MEDNFNRAELTPNQIRAIIELANQLKSECKHEIVTQYGNDPIYNDMGSVKCTICGKDLGWWCPDSPNHQCEYYGNHRGGRMINGNQWEFNGKWTDEDDCIYCHQPEERK